MRRILSGLLVTGMMVSAFFAASAFAKEGKSGIQGTTVLIREEGSYKIEVGKAFALPYSITTGIGGNPNDFQVTIEGDDEAVSSEKNEIVEQIPRLVGATNVVAILKAKQEGTATITLGVKGKDKKATYRITVVKAQGE